MKKMKLIIPFFCSLILIQSCSKSQEEILYSGKWQITSKMINGVETIQPCEKDNTYALCYCGKITIEDLGTRCSISASPASISNEIVVSNNNKTITTNITGETISYSITTLEEKKMVWESQSSVNKQIIQFSSI